MRYVHARVGRTLRRDCRVGPNDRIVVALSGGADSVALTWILHALAPDLGFELAGVAHVNHQLRGAASDEDEAFCRALTARLDLPIVVTRVDVAAQAKTRRVSLEVAARDARYAAFDDARSRFDATVVATGHTMDDQAETVLLRLLRGAGTRGLSGIRVRRGPFVRPLLDTRRADLRAYLDARGESWRDDGSNADVSIPRNRVRHELMPVVATMAPGAVAALARLATLAQDDETYLEEAAIKNRPALVLLEESGRVEVDASALSLLPPTLSRRFIRGIAADLTPGAAWSARHLEAVSELIGTDKPVGHLDLPGLVVERQADVLTFRVTDGAPRSAPGASRSRGSRASAEQHWPLRTLDVPGEVAVPEAGITIVSRTSSAVSSEMGPIEYEGSGAAGTALQASSVRLPLSVRNRRAGDRFRPLGAPGRRKLQDVFVDRKVPRSERDRVPVVVDADDRIVWVAGVSLAHDCRVTAPSNGVLILEKRTAE